MKYSVSILLLIFFFISCTTSNTLIKQNKDEENAFLVYGDDFMVGLPLPSRWNVDMQFAKQNNINGFWYVPEISTPIRPVAIILTLANKPSKDAILSDFYNYDKETLTSYYDNSSFKKSSDSVKSEHGYQIELFEFFIVDGHYQLIAYIDCNKKYFMKLYLDTGNASDYEEFKSDFLFGLEKVTYLNITLSS